MGEHKLDKQPRPSEELFLIQDPEVGKTFPIRECTDEQLERYLRKALQDQQMHRNMVMQGLAQADMASRASAALAYEIDRRKRSITLATASDLANLRRQ